MYNLWRYFNIEKSEEDQPLIKFGKWEPQLDYLNYCYHDMVKRLIQFAKEAGVDPYGRYFDFEPLIDFVISAGISDKSADYMYRHYVYHILSKHEQIDVEKEEIRYLINEFMLVPEGVQVYYDNNDIKNS